MARPSGMSSGSTRYAIDATPIRWAISQAEGKDDTQVARISGGRWWSENHYTVIEITSLSEQRES